MLSAPSLRCACCIVCCVPHILSRCARCELCIAFVIHLVSVWSVLLLTLKRNWSKRDIAKAKEGTTMGAKSMSHGPNGRHSCSVLRRCVPRGTYIFYRTPRCVLHSQQTALPVQHGKPTRYHTANQLSSCTPNNVRYIVNYVLDQRPQPLTELFHH